MGIGFALQQQDAQGLRGWLAGHVPEPRLERLSGRRRIIDDGQGRPVPSPLVQVGEVELAQKAGVPPGRIEFLKKLNRESCLAGARGTGENSERDAGRGREPAMQTGEVRLAADHWDGAVFGAENLKFAAPVQRLRWAQRIER